MGQVAEVNEKSDKAGLGAMRSLLQQATSRQPFEL
jgi:hypothetical protein